MKATKTIYYVRCSWHLLMLSYLYFCLNKLPVLARCQTTHLLIIARFVLYPCFLILAITPEDFAAACEECILCKIYFFLFYFQYKNTTWIFFLFARNIGSWFYSEAYHHHLDVDFLVAFTETNVLVYCVCFDLKYW